MVKMAAQHGDLMVKMAQQHGDLMVKMPNNTVTRPKVYYLHFGLHLHGVFVLLRDQEAGGVRGLEHVHEQVIGQHVQLLHLVP